MPPVAAIRAMQPNRQTARNGQDRSLQTYRKFAIFPLRFSTVWCGAKGTAYLALHALSVTSLKPASVSFSLICSICAASRVSSPSFKKQLVIAIFASLRSW